VIAVNHRDASASLAGDGVELLSGEPVDGSLTVPAGGVAVLRTPLPRPRGGGRAESGDH
jgi:beta-galactosidase